MDETRKTSPFAALSQQERLQKWICWQNQKNLTVEKDANEPTMASDRPESVLLNEKPTESRFVPLPVHHGQYTAVLRRMQEAGRCAGSFHTCGS